MLGLKSARRRRARKRSERILSEARAAADSVRRTYRQPGKTPADQPPFDDNLAEAIQAAIMGSVLPYVNETGNRESDRDRHGGGTLTLLLGIGLGVGIAAWARHDDGSADPLPEDEEWELVNGPSTRMVKAAINETLDKADTVLRRLAKTTAETMGAAVGTVADAAGPTAEIVTDKLRAARQKATSEVIRTLDDLDAVWDDETEGPDRVVKPVATRPTPRKPVEGKPSATSRSKRSTPSKSTRPERKPKKAAGA